MLEPIILPTAMSLLLRKAATTDVASSGSDVPIATIVRPIMVSLMPNSLAIFTALTTTNLPPATRKTNPTIIYSHIVRFLYVL